MVRSYLVNRRLPVTTPATVQTVYDVRAEAVIANIIDVDLIDTSRT